MFKEMFSSNSEKTNKNSGIEVKKKKSFSFLNKKHVRSQSAASQSSDNTSSNRGWLEPANVQVTPSRSSEISIPSTAILRKPIISDASQQDILGAVSDEDIFKLTEITSRLPEISVLPKPPRYINPRPKKEIIIEPVPKPIVHDPTEAESIMNEFYQKQRERQQTISTDEQSLDDISVKALLEDQEDIRMVETIEESLIFDYHSLPKEVKEVLDIYQHKRKVERRQMIVKYRERDGLEEDEMSLDEEDPDTVDFHDLIIGGHDKVNYQLNPVRDIAILTTTISDNIEFTKLIQLDDTTEGPLLDLHVSMFNDDKNDEELLNTDEELLELLSNVEKKVDWIQQFKEESESFLNEQLESLSLIEESKQTKLSRTFSYPSLQSIIQEKSTQRNTKSMILDDYDINDSFKYKKNEIEKLVEILNSELVDFKSTLNHTENLVGRVQSDMDDFRNSMEKYIKDIPESHYSALKKLEVDIESILSKRAKSPWLDTGYALLSYLLTFFAFIVWIIISILKLIKKIILFPNKLWKDCSDYLIERNEKVKEKSMLHVLGNSIDQQDNLSKPSSSLFKRKSAFSQRKIN